MKRKKLALIAVSAAAALTLAGCAGGSTVSDASVRASDAARTGSLVVAAATPPATLNPFAASNGAPNAWYEEPAYASILNVSNDNTIVAGLADKWGYVGTGNTHFEFTLRNGLKFADGTPLTATQVVASFNAFIAAASGPTSGDFQGMKFAALSSTEVEITTPAPNPNVALMLTPNYYFGDPISPAGLADPSSLASATYGAGEYVLDTSATISGTQYVYKKNPNYWDPKQIGFSTITVKVIPTPTQEVTALESGQVDLASVDPSVGGTLTGAHLVQIQRPEQWTGIFFADRDGAIVPALKSSKVRQALNYAVDRPGIAAAAYGKYAKATDEPVVQGDATGGYDPALASKYAYNVKKAKKLLAEAGYAKGFTIPTLYQSFNVSSTKAVQAITSELAAIHVTLKLKAEPTFGAWVSDWVSKKYAATYLANNSTSQYLNVEFAWTPKAAMNPLGVTDPAVQSAFEKLISASSAQVPTEAKAMTKVLVDDAVAMPIAVDDQLFMYDTSKVSGVRFMGGTGNLNPITSWRPAK